MKEINNYIKMISFNDYISEKLKIGKDTLSNNATLEEIGSIIKNYFKNILHLDTSKYIYAFYKIDNKNTSTILVNNIDDLDIIHIYSKEFDDIKLRDKTKEYLFDEINNIISLDTSKVKNIDKSIYLYIKK